MTTYHLVKKSNLYKMLSKICTVVSDDCLLHETACNTKCIGKLVLIIVYDLFLNLSSIVVKTVLIPYATLSGFSLKAASHFKCKFSMTV